MRSGVAAALMVYSGWAKMERLCFTQSIASDGCMLVRVLVRASCTQ